MFVKYLIISVIFINLITSVYSKDYYELLGISRDASKFDIRRAFKKLALEKHPDKNKEANAHEVFTKISKAYEVLKDDEMRKKYDTYGEEGLRDDHFSTQYESWNFYNEQFGLYDSDEQIITLSQSDFEQSVSDSEDVWFINFYSVHCSHCHDLAPTWREVASDLNGVIRIGAVNCQDEWHFCSMQDIRQYPTMKIYPSGEYYEGEHDKEEMVKYLLDRLETKIYRLHMGFVENEMANMNNPWIISFCGTDNDNCASERTILKLSVMLENLVTVATATQRDVRKYFDRTDSLVFYPAGQVNEKSGTPISSYDAMEITIEVLRMLAHPSIVNDLVFQGIKANISQGDTTPWVLIFFAGEDEKNIEMMKLTALVPQMNIGSINCGNSRDLCAEFHITKYPSVVLYKQEGYEFHHGRYNAYDMANFVRESVASKVKTLGPQDFPAVTQSTEQNWFIDFYTPWCPPCLKLLPEWRKASKQIGGKVAQFGTVDCTIHQHLCRQANVNQYPTTVFYNKSVPHVFTGYHTVDEIIAFAEDILKPPVLKLTPETFEKLVNQKTTGQTWLVDFYAPWCGPCMELAPIYRQLAKKLSEDAHLGEIDCQKHHYFCNKQNVNSYPTIRLYPHQYRGSSYFIVHQGWRDLNSLYTWVFQYFPSLVATLDDGNFINAVITSTDAYLVDFYASWCGPCHAFAPKFAKLAQRLEGKIKVAKVDCEQSSICQSVGVHQYPTVRLYVGSTAEGIYQGMEGISLNTLDTKTLYSLSLKLVNKHLAENQEKEIVHDEF